MGRVFNAPNATIENDPRFLQLDNLFYRMLSALPPQGMKIQDSAASRPQSAVFPNYSVSNVSLVHDVYQATDGELSQFLGETDYVAVQKDSLLKESVSRFNDFVAEIHDAREKIQAILSGEMPTQGEGAHIFTFNDRLAKRLMSNLSTIGDSVIEPLSHEF